MTEKTFDTLISDAESPGIASLITSDDDLENWILVEDGLGLTHTKLYTTTRSSIAFIHH